jgi:GcrA cell cycle regulator
MWKQEHFPMNWTDERVELLKKLWAEGLSASQIATQLGGVSRNAVIGKVHRLKLSGRGRSSSAPPRQKKAAAPAAPRAAKPQRPATAGAAVALAPVAEAVPAVRHETRSNTDVVVPISRNLVLTELTERTCKWPNGDPLSEEFSFCGNEAADGSPYCRYHGRLAYQPVAERRRSR